MSTRIATALAVALSSLPLLAHAQSSHHPLESKLESFAYTP